MPQSKSNYLPGIKTAAVGVVGGIAAYAATIPVMTGALGLAGFTSGGIAAGSFAASVQGAITAAGSPFAILQAAGATGCAVLIPVAPIVGGVLGATSVVMLAKKYRSRA